VRNIALKLKKAKNEPRKMKRLIWKNAWKYSRNQMKGTTRKEQRQYWRKLWNELRRPNIENRGDRYLRRLEKRHPELRKQNVS